MSARATRRTFLAGCAGLALGAGPGRAGAGEGGDSTPLGELAARSGRFFGTAIASDAIRDNGAYFDLVTRQCSLFVPEWEMKWGALSHTLGAPADFTFVDQVVAAAMAGGKFLRGHALLWHQHLPEGIQNLKTPADWDKYVAPHITEVAMRYRDDVLQWDVVNEAIEPRDAAPGLMRRSPFWTMFGTDYVAEAFRLAAAAAPSGRLYLNDYSVCYDESWQEDRRKGVLKLLERLLKAGVPVHGFGIQAHLDTRFSYQEKIFAKFLDALDGLGLDYALTELDVREADRTDGLDIPARQRRAADEVEKLLVVALDRPALTGVVTWGLSDGQSWLRSARSLPDNQGLPYDDRLAPTPMRDTLARLFAGARARNAVGA